MIHVYPIGDLWEHDIKNTTCKCNPEIEIDDGEMIIIHNSFDGRESKEYDEIDNYGKETRYRYIGDDIAKSSMVWHRYKNYPHDPYTLDQLLDIRKSWQERIGSPATPAFDDDECKKEIKGCELVLTLII